VSSVASTLLQSEIDRFVDTYLARRSTFLELVKRSGSPLWVIDQPALAARARRFRGAFGAQLERFQPFYAVKSNNHPAIAAQLVREGFGLDVSSGLELQAGVEAGASRILFSGPAKTLPELELALSHRDCVTVLIDSFSELTKLGDLASARGVRVKAGVRITVDDNGIWRKFGIPMARLGEFFSEAARRTAIDLCGLQFHLSRNMTPDNQVAFITRLGAALRNLGSDLCRQLSFVDIGGGYWPETGEWVFAPAEATDHSGRRLDPLANPGRRARLKNDACDIAVFAREITAALRQHVFPVAVPEICCEPGRWLCHGSMHLLQSVVDKKSDDLVITDGGTNAIGWERFESDYFPVINLSRPLCRERDCLVLGSLCTPHDVWGYSYHGDGIEPGDVLLIPTQGAYTYSLRQHFIKPLPEVVLLTEDAPASP